MLVAVDDTDSRNGMCTTYLLTELIYRSGLDVIGYPRLVRLNPAIEYKTRGNGALAVNLGTGSGESRKIGNINGRDVISYTGLQEEASADYVLGVARETVEELAVMDEPDTNPGVVVSRSYLPVDFYWKAVREEVTIKDAESFIEDNNGKYAKFKNGRGIIGAAASLSWPGLQKTFEVLTYRNAVGNLPNQSMKLKLAEQANNIPGTFNNIDYSNQYAAVFPKERTPVIMGIRGKSGSQILEGIPRLLSGTWIRPDRHLCYETNQATDDHIIENGTNLAERQSYALTGTVISKPNVIEGSHYFSRINSNGREITMAAFEPTKQFRNIFRQLLPGDLVRVYGSYVNQTINIEKMEIIDLSVPYRREAPTCDNCGKRMTNKGRMDYRCRECHTRKATPPYRKIERQLLPGKYDVPVIARRHLSKPFDLESLPEISMEAGAA